MRFKDIENYVNDYITKNDLIDERKYFSDCSREIEKIITDYLKENSNLRKSEYGGFEDFYFNDYGYKGNLCLRVRNGNKYSTNILIKINRKKQQEKGGFWNNNSLYGIKGISIENGDIDTIEDLIGKVNKQLKEEKNYQIRKLQVFKKTLKENNLTINDYFKMKDLYDNLDYNSKCELEELAHNN